MYNLMLTLHILGAGVLIGITVFSVMLTIKKPIVFESIKMMHLMHKLGPIAAGALLLTGIYLVSQNPEGLKGNPIFLAKIGLFVLDGLIAGVVINRKINYLATQNNSQVVADDSSLYFLTLANLVILTAIVALGVML